MTYGELKNLIQNYLQNSETSFTTYLPDIIKQAEDRILENVQLPVFRKNQVGSLSSSNQYLGIPTDFLAPYSLSFTNSSNQTFLINKDVNWIRELYPNASTTGEPEYYAIFDNDYFIVAPTPDSAYNVELHYFYRPASLTAAGDSGPTWISKNAPNCLLYGCLAEAAIFLKMDPPEIALYEQRFQDGIERLKNTTEGAGTHSQYRYDQVRIPTT